MKSRIQQKRRPRPPAKVVRKFNTPGAKPLLDLAEEHLLQKAVMAATKVLR